MASDVPPAIKTLLLPRAAELPAATRTVPPFPCPDAEPPDAIILPPAALLAPADSLTLPLAPCVPDPASTKTRPAPTAAPPDESVREPLVAPARPDATKTEPLTPVEPLSAVTSATVPLDPADELPLPTASSAPVPAATAMLSPCTPEPSAMPPPTRMPALERTFICAARIRASPEADNCTRLGCAPRPELTDTDLPATITDPP